MGTITFVSSRGDRTEVPAIAGESIMEAASKARVRGIIGECGGCLSCATCHVYVPAEWAGLIPPPTPDEATLIECVANLRDNSRLSCQILFRAELDRIELHLPVSQY